MPLEKRVKEKIIINEKIGELYTSKSSPIMPFSVNMVYDSKVELNIGEPVGILDQEYDTIFLGIVQELSVKSDLEMADVVLTYNKSDLLKTKEVVYNIATIRIVRRLFGNDNVVQGLSPHSPVYKLGEKGIYETYQISTDGIPVGVLCYPSGMYDSNIVIRLDPEYLLGYEAAHLNVGGQSGYGKSSFVIGLLKGIEVWARNNDVKVGTLIFNVKKDDFLYLDQLNFELTDEDKKIYEKMGIPIEPLSNVVFYGTKKGEYDDTVATLRYEDLPIESFHWEWHDIQNDIRYAISRNEAWDDIMDYALQLIIEEDLGSFEDVVNRITQWRETGHLGVRQVSWNKLLRIINGIHRKNIGLLYTSKPIDYEAVFRAHNYLVIDINEIFFQNHTQRLVVGKIINDVKTLMEEDKLGLDYLIFLMDELGKYGNKDAGGAMSQIKDVVIGVSERGRSIGIPLFGIQQYASKIDDALLGNVATLVFTRLRTKELRNPLYSQYSQNTQNIISKLQKGMAYVDHDPFQELLLIRYPRPTSALKPLSKYVNSKKEKQQENFKEAQKKKQKQKTLDVPIGDEEIHSLRGEGF
jgi:DNA helicase HerA-like ATPase